MNAKEVKELRSGDMVQHASGLMFSVTRNSEENGCQLMCVVSLLRPVNWNLVSPDIGMRERNRQNRVGV